MEKEIIINNIQELLNIIGKHNSYAPNLYRGICRKEYLLIPAIGRNFEEIDTQVIKDKNAISGFYEMRENKYIELLKGLAIPYLNDLNVYPETYLEWVVIAQHYGIPTRLMDWSTNCLVALYFATEKDFDFDGSLYVIRNVANCEFEHSLLFGVNNIIRPKHISPRIEAQSSIFTNHIYPWIPFENDKLEQLIIPKEFKNALHRELAYLGITYSKLFPGLEGICRDIKGIYDY
jgi:hypothetical protein